MYLFIMTSQQKTKILHRLMSTCQQRIVLTSMKFRGESRLPQTQGGTDPTRLSSSNGLLIMETKKGLHIWCEHTYTKVRQ